MSNTQTTIKKTPFDVFVDGAKKGWTIATTSTLPNVLMAFVIIQFLEVSGLLKIIGTIFGPLMRIFGLPGEAGAIIVSAFLSMGGACGAAAKLYSSGILTVQHLAIMLPAIFLVGSQVQYMGRVLGTAGVKGRYYGIMIGLSFVNAFASMLIMRVIVSFYSF